MRYNALSLPGGSFMQSDPTIAQLRRYITDEIVAALGFPKHGWLRRVCNPLFWPPAQLFSQIMSHVDRVIAESGVPAAAGQLLTRFVEDVEMFGQDAIPKKGPLLIASNHPGAYDSIAILSCLPRQDIKVVVSDIPFLRSLPAASQHMVFTPADASARMATVRGMIRQMEAGGALLIFPSGLVDPDPIVTPGAERELENWSESLDIVLRRVPETRLQAVIVSGVLAPSCLKHPLTRLLKERWRQQKLAEFIQVIQQLVLKRRFNLIPKLSFGDPMNASELMSKSHTQDLHRAIIQCAHEVLESHLRLCPD